VRPKALEREKREPRRADEPKIRASRSCASNGMEAGSRIGAEWGAASAFSVRGTMRRP
jgi:hypothetical protein